MKRATYGSETIEGLGRLVADIRQERVARHPVRVAWSWQFSLIRGLTYGPIPVSHALILLVALRYYL